MKPFRGFSLVELMVALLLSGILMAGMGKIFASSISSFYTTGELLGAQRRNRWILNEFGDDLRMAGYMEGILASKIPLTNLPESPFVITPGLVAGSDRDQIEFFMNQPVQELRVTSTAAQNTNSLAVTSISGDSLGIKTGDFLIIKDGIQVEYGYASSDVSISPVTLMDGTAQLANPAIFGYMRSANAAFMNRHLPGNLVSVLRPCQLIHYGVEDRALDPSAPATTIPCLIRKQALFGSGVQGNWGTVTGEVVAENVSALRVDLSVDGGVNWDHGANWAATVALANTHLNAANQINSNTFWFRQVPALLRVEIRSRTPLARTEYSATAGTTAFKERTQVLVIAPRNFASPL
jgi:prepilin-type N-terminal cleavage/methylation domain-containing protein